MSLAEASLDQPGPRVWAARIVIALAVVALVALLTIGLKSLMGGTSAPARQVAKIALLPDTPPPPPPKEEPKKEPPKEEPKQQIQQEQPKPQLAPPAAAPLKMEGAA